MNQQIECRSPQQIDEDDLIDAHTDLVQALSEFCPPMGMLYKGERRKRMQDLCKDMEARILAGDLRGPSIGCTWWMLVYYTVHR